MTFGLMYAFSENFVLPLSHDEVVHGKGSLLGQDARRRLAEASPTCARTVRLHVGHPGKKLLFMGRVRPGRSAGARPQPLLRERPALHVWTSSRRLRVDRLPRRPTRSVYAWLRKRSAPATSCARGVQLHAGAAPDALGVPPGRPLARACSTPTRCSTAAATSATRRCAEASRVPSHGRASRSITLPPLAHVFWCRPRDRHDR
jgi:hypothetical protein